MNTRFSPIAVFDPASYPDERGFRARIANVIPARARATDHFRAQAVSYCPDTAKPFYTWALEGDEVVSPYSGRRMRQRDTGFFGPKERDDEGRITRFGGDPLKRDLQGAMARLLMDPRDALSRTLVHAPGSLRQQYHFAAVNWARLYPLLADSLGAQWRHEFAGAVARYREERPARGVSVDGVAARPFHDLVGEDRYVLGGDSLDGGTENHKMMWRTSGLLYAQILGDDALISGVGAPEARHRILGRLSDYLDRLLTMGAGEYDSSIYYRFTIVGLLNLYDFSPDPRTRAIARAILDFFFATCGLKLLCGALIGAEKRGFDNGAMGETGLLMWMFAPQRGAAPGPDLLAPVHQATTSYRPNRVIQRIMAGQVPMPFEARMARPSYHMDRANEGRETFYRHRDFALGSVALDGISNPAQQTIWKLGVRSPAGALICGGGQPRFRSPCGHSPHDQVLQKRAALMMITGPDSRGPDASRLRRTPAGASPAQRWRRAATAAETWVYLPRTATVAMERNASLLCDFGRAFAVFHALAGEILPLGPDRAHADMAALLDRYAVYVLPGAPCGFVLDVASADDFACLDSFGRALRERTRLDCSDFVLSGRAVYRSLLGDTLEMRYRSGSLCCAGRINGATVDWKNWCDGAGYQSPACAIGSRRMQLSDGESGYEMMVDNCGIHYFA
jgi:hypothetical protein